MKRSTTTAEYIPARPVPLTQREQSVRPERFTSVNRPVIGRERKIQDRPGFVLRPVRVPHGVMIPLLPPAPVATEVAQIAEIPTIPTYILLGVTATTDQVGLVTGDTFEHPAVIPVLPRKKIALLLPGHNEELIIRATIRSAIAAGLAIEDIYVVDDDSSDSMYELAVAELGPQQVLHVERSGKALAVKKAIEAFSLASQYEWVHVADADSVFSPNYFTEYKKKLDKSDYAVALGFVQSMRGNWISTYRALTYTYSQQVTRRVQSKLGMISVFPGPITAFKTDILPDLDFMSNSLTEDFDITLQVHRKKLGRIAFIPNAVNFTQDPQTLEDFWRQNLRWQRGFFQGVKKYKIGRRLQLIDLSLGWQMFQSFFFLIILLGILPWIVISTGNWMTIPVMIAADIIINGIVALASSAVAKRWNLLGALPYFYFLRWIEIAAYFVAFIEIMVLGKFQTEVRGWGTEGRRYKLSDAALAEIGA